VAVALHPAFHFAAVWNPALMIAVTLGLSHWCSGKKF